MRPMALLIEVILLQSYEPEGSAAELFEGLEDAAKALFFPSNNGRMMSNVNGNSNGNARHADEVDEDDEDEEGEEAEPIAVLINFLVDLLQRPAVLLRTTVERVFAAFSGEIGEQALQLLVDVGAPHVTSPQEPILMMKIAL